jgi:GMP synthase (glutamine-hydrolysing)
LVSHDRRLLLLKTGSKIDSLAAVPGDYEDWIAAAMGDALGEAAVIDLPQGEAPPPPQKVSAVVITGSGAMVTEKAPWMVHAAAWLREAVAAGVPVLGICFGHQLLADALGGEVADNPGGVEVGTVTIRLSDAARQDPLFAGMPRAFAAQVSHRQSVLRLPPGARLLAASEREPHQAFAVGRCAWGVQFHPEFDAKIVRRFIDHYRESLQQQGDSPAQLSEGVQASPQSAALLARFAALAGDCGEGESPL